VKKTCKTSEYLTSLPSLELSTLDYNWSNTVSTNWSARLLLFLFFVVVVIAVVGGNDGSVVCGGVGVCSGGGEYSH
jgi:hypothetical protein